VKPRVSWKTLIEMSMGNLAALYFFYAAAGRMIGGTADVL
jgi:hypothetical protein